MTTLPAVQAVLPGFVLLPAMSREEYDALPLEVRAFVTWADARRSKVVVVPSAPPPISDEKMEQLLAILCDRAPARPFAFDARVRRPHGGFIGLQRVHLTRKGANAGANGSKALRGGMGR